MLLKMRKFNQIKLHKWRQPIHMKIIRVYQMRWTKWTSNISVRRLITVEFYQNQIPKMVGSIHGRAVIVVGEMEEKRMEFGSVRMPLTMNGNKLDNVYHNFSMDLMFWWLTFSVWWMLNGGCCTVSSSHILGPFSILQKKKLICSIIAFKRWNCVFFHRQMEMKYKRNS